MINIKKLSFFAILAIALISFLLLSRKEPVSEVTSTIQPLESSELMPWPLDKPGERQKVLKFGTYVTPDPGQNPISPPERFTGFHTGLDIEILPEEKEVAVPVKTICEGKIFYTSAFVEGYGGIIIQECNINSEPTSVLYGHLKPSSIKVTQGDEIVKPGTTIAELGKANTEETGNTRKHLHLGVHKGNHIEFLGYVNEEKDLQEFIDPLPLLQK